MHKINSSVGRGGRNLSTDVVIVQTLLNRHIVPPAKLLVVDGVAGAKTIGAILDLQHKLGMENCDGRVDPSGKTLQALLSSPNSVQLMPNLPNLLPHGFPMLANLPRNILDHFKSAEPKKTASFKPYKQHPPPVIRPMGGDAIAWGAKVSREFKKRVIEICRELEVSPDYLMTCMAFETGESFRADQPNLGGGSAIGLIQFTKPAWRGLNTSRDELAKMSSVQQLEYVRRYFIKYKGRLKTLEDVYMVILCPAAVGKGAEGILYSKEDQHPINYEKNRGLDNCPKDGEITVGECSAVLRRVYKKGLSSGFIG